FFLYSHLHLPDLHSFPTRRSSDLFLIDDTFVPHVAIKPTPDGSFVVMRRGWDGAWSEWITMPPEDGRASAPLSLDAAGEVAFLQDRKSTRLNSSHVAISYAVFCLK